MTIDEAIKEVKDAKKYSCTLSDETLDFILYMLALMKLQTNIFDWNTELVKPLYENNTFRESILNKFMKKE